jgi:hypothetical protein
LLSDDERQHYAALVGAYVGERASHYVHRVKGPVAQAEQLQAAGAVLYQLLQALKPAYAEQPAYQVVARLFGEQFEVVAEAVAAKANQALTAHSLQSLDDLEATYREKNQVGYRGYVANVSETCDPANPVQLITDVRVASNTTQDSALLISSVPDLKRRTGLATLYTDGGFGSPEADVVLQDQQVTLLQTGLMGKAASPEHLHLADFTITQDASGQPLTVTCPQGQTTAVQPGRRPGRFSRSVEPARCTRLAAVHLNDVMIGVRKAYPLVWPMWPSPSAIAAAGPCRRVRAIPAPRSRPPSVRSNIPFAPASYRCAACSG